MFERWECIVLAAPKSGCALCANIFPLLFAITKDPDVVLSPFPSSLATNVVSFDSLFAMKDSG